MIYLLLHLSFLATILFSIKLFYFFWFFSSIVFVVNYKKCFQILFEEKYLFLFIILGHYYFLLSSINSFGNIFSFDTDLSYLLRQSYFIPFLGISIPTLIVSSNVGLMKFINAKNIQDYRFVFFVLILIIYYLNILGQSYQYLLLLIILLSINNRLLSIILFLPLYVYPVVSNQLTGTEYGFQHQLMTFLTAMFFLFNFYIKRWMFISLSIISFLVLIVLTNIIDESIRYTQFSLFFEGNSVWRIGLWMQNIRFAIENTFGLGVGLGTSYFLSDIIPTGEYYSIHQGPDYMGNPYHEDYVTGQHNSIVNVFYRFGFIGLLLFMGFISDIYKKIQSSELPSQYYLLLSIALITIAVNVGLESPKYMLVFAFFISLILSRFYMEKYSRLSNRELYL